jgi:hypothetical protein
MHTVVLLISVCLFLKLRGDPNKVSPTDDKTDGKKEHQDIEAVSVSGGDEKGKQKGSGDSGADGKVKKETQDQKKKNKADEEMRRKRRLLVVPVRSSGEKAEKQAVAEAGVLFKVRFVVLCSCSVIFHVCNSGEEAEKQVGYIYIYIYICMYICMYTHTHATGHGHERRWSAITTRTRNRT